MITISLCMIVRDEESVLGRLLEQMKDVVDEIIIVDTGSPDSTHRRSFITNGMMISLPPGISRVRTLPWIIGCGWTQMMQSRRKTRRACWN